MVIRMNLRIWKWPLANQILLGLAVGGILGLFAEQIWGKSPGLSQAISQYIQPIGKIFLRLIFMVVIPLLLSAIVLGVMEMRDTRTLGRIGLRCLLLTIFLSCVSAGIGISLVNILQPGHRLPPDKKAELMRQYQSDASTKVIQSRQKLSLADTILSIIPENPLYEATNAFDSKHTGGGLLAIMFFGLILGVAILVSDQEKIQTLVRFFEGLFTVSMTIIGFAMKLAPLGVACLVFATTAKLGFSIVKTLGLYMGIVLLALAIHQFVTYPLILIFLGKKSPLTFFKEIKEVLLTAFSTSSSNATLPVSLRVAEQNLKLPPQISRFVLTVGATANQNGTALYEGVTVLFLAQVFGADLTFSQQMLVAFACVIAGIGTAGVPGGSLPMIAGVLASVKVPAESIAIILGVDRFLDMCRTTLNVTGDLVIAVVTSRGETQNKSPNSSISLKV